MAAFIVGSGLAPHAAPRVAPSRGGATPARASRHEHARADEHPALPPLIAPRRRDALRAFLGAASVACAGRANAGGPIPGSEFCICHDGACYGENCGGLKRPDVKYIEAAREGYSSELDGAAAAIRGKRRGGGGAPPPPDAPFTDDGAATADAS